MLLGVLSSPLGPAFKFFELFLAAFAKSICHSLRALIRRSVAGLALFRLAKVSSTWQSGRVLRGSCPGQLFAFETLGAGGF